MPLGLKRFHETKHSHFFTMSCYRRMRRFENPAVCDVFVESLEKFRVEYRFLVYGYVVMPEHVHLLVSEPERATLASAIQALKVSVAKRSRNFADWGEHFWYKRGYDRNIPCHEEFIEKLRYIHRNPVRRGLVHRPEAWKWSSFRHYLTGDIGVVEIESEWTAKRRQGLPVNVLRVPED